MLPIQNNCLNRYFGKTNHDDLPLLIMLNSNKKKFEVGPQTYNPFRKLKKVFIREMTDSSPTK